MWMAHHRDGDESFVRLSTQLIDVYSKQTPADIVVPPSSKPGAFVALTENSVREGRCNRAYERGMCNINGCDLFHGRWNKHSWKLCDRAWERRTCMRQWSEGGCRFSHDSSLFSARKKRWRFLDGSTRFGDDDGGCRFQMVVADFRWWLQIFDNGCKFWMMAKDLKSTHRWGFLSKADEWKLNWPQRCSKQQNSIRTLLWASAKDTSMVGHKTLDTD